MKVLWLEGEGKGQQEPLSSIVSDIDFEILCLERYHDIILHLIKISDNNNENRGPLLPPMDRAGDSVINRHSTHPR